MRSNAVRVLIPLLFLACVACSSEVEAQPVTPYAFGEKVPAGTFVNLNRGEGQPVRVNLGTVLGKKPVILYYWVPGNPTSEAMFRELESLVRELRNKVVLIGMVVERPPQLTQTMMSERIEALGIGSSVLHDDDFEVGKRLSVTRVPNVTLIDADGVLRLTSGASLKQQVEYGMTLRDLIVRAAETGDAGTYGALPVYYPVEELKGEPCPEFQAARLDDGVVQRSKSLLRDDQINVLVFWSVDCGHCQKHMPEINDYMKKRGKGVNLISAARVDNPTMKIKTQEYCEYNDLVFPTMIDENRKLSEIFKVTATPTMVVIAPDGTVEEVLVSGREFESVLENLKATHKIAG